MPKKHRHLKHPKLLAILLAICFAVPAAVYAVNTTIHTYTTAKSQAGVNGASSTQSREWEKFSDTMYVLDINDDGKADVTLNMSKNSDGNDVWTYTFNIEDNDVAYNVYEEMTNNGYSPLLPGYTSKGSDDKAATPQEYGTIDPKTHSYTITNHKDHAAVSTDTGSLKITKLVTGTMKNPAQKFKFTVTLSADDSKLSDQISGAKVFGDVPFVDGVAHIGLGKDESAEMKDIPAGVSYTITEEAVDNYETTSKTHDTGTIVKDDDPSKWSDSEVSVWTNNGTYVPPAERDLNTFILKKTVEGGIAPSEKRQFSFIVHVENLSQSVFYDYQINDQAPQKFQANDIGTADISLMLQDGDAAKFTIPVESTYQIAEAGKGYDSEGNETNDMFEPSYKITDAKNQDKIAAVEDSANVGDDLATKVETVDAGEDVTVNFINKYSAVQNLTIRKFVSIPVSTGTATTDKSSDEYQMLSDEDKKTVDYTGKKEYEVTLTLYNLPQNFSADSSIGKITSDESGEYNRTFKIKADGTPVVFSNLPAGTKYQISESENRHIIPSYEITTVDVGGSEITGSYVLGSATGNEGKPLATNEETLEEGQSDIVTFTNNIVSPVKVPTGIQLMILPAVGAIGLAIAIAVGLVHSHKAHREG